jgi:hypothetical protein
MCAGGAACTEAGVTCGDCQPMPPLNPGRLADDLDSTVQADGTLVFAGYAPGDPDSNRLYGDLVIGTHDAATNAVTWQIVDGMPAEGEIGADPNGWRGGVKNAGPDVGRYASIEAIGDDLIVAYADVDNGSLKVATRIDGTWAAYDIDPGGNIVAWTSMTIDNLGLPVISYVVYLRQADPTDTETKPTSSLRIARPNTPLPGVGLGDAGLPPPAPADAGIVDLDGWQWTITELSGADMGCNNNDLCADGFTCVTRGAGECVAPTNDCGGDPDAGGGNNCGSSNPICYDGECLQRKSAADYYVAQGLYTDIERTSTGLALVYYDRTAGDIMGRTCAADPCDAVDAWSAPFLIDGWSLDADAHSHPGDSGIGASLFVDASDVWHVTYVNGTWEELRYAKVEGGIVTAYELIDDGSAGLTGLARDQIDIVGDDSSIVATTTEEGLELRVAYVDATQHVTILATRSPATNTWGWQILPTSHPDGQAYGSVTSVPASGLVSYVGAQWLVLPMESTDGEFLSNTDAYTLGLPPVPDGGVSDGGL